MFFEKISEKPHIFYIPVLAAGGIVNEAMAKASACVGAEGAYVGTRFVLSKECRAAQATKEDILNLAKIVIIIGKSKTQ